jgi:hypothetical protein
MAGVIDIAAPLNPVVLPGGPLAVTDKAPKAESEPGGFVPRAAYRACSVGSGVTLSFQSMKPVPTTASGSSLLPKPGAENVIESSCSAGKGSVNAPEPSVRTHGAEGPRRHTLAPCTGVWPSILTVPLKSTVVAGSMRTGRSRASLPRSTSSYTTSSPRTATWQRPYHLHGDSSAQRLSSVRIGSEYTL